MTPTRPTYPGHFPGANRAGIRHEDYVAAVVGFVEGRDLRDVVLVGHSFGGSVVSRVSQVIPERLGRLVFHTAFVVADGASVNDEFPDEQTAMFEAAARDSPDGTVECSWEVFRDLFIQDASPEAARSVWERLVPQPFAPWAQKLDLTQFYRGELPRSYIAVADDLALPAGHLAPADVVATRRVQAGRDGREPRGHVHPSGRAGPQARRGFVRLTPRRCVGGADRTGQAEVRSPEPAHRSSAGTGRRVSRPSPLDARVTRAIRPRQARAGYTRWVARA